MQVQDGAVRVHGEFAQGDTLAGSTGAVDPTPPPPPRAPEVPAAAPAPASSPIPGYLVLEELGRGGMAVVFKARQQSLDRIVALKIMSQRLAQDEDFVKRFVREAKALAALDHENITRVYDRGQADDKIFFVMEFVEGHSLRDALKHQGGRLPQEQTLDVMIQVARALSYVHKRGTIHRDIKPENVLLTVDPHTGGDKVKVTDFGLAAMADKGINYNLTADNMMMGTLNYMPPEQRADAKSVDHRADIYSYGVMLYELLTGTVPLGKWEPASSLVPELDSRLDDVIGNCLKNNRNERYQSIDEALTAMIEITTGPGATGELNIPLMGADLHAGPPAAAHVGAPPPTYVPGAGQGTPSYPGGPGSLGPTRSADPDDKKDLEQLVAQAKRNMVAQRTRGLPTRVHAFPGLDPPRRRGRIFLLALLAMGVVLGGGYWLFEGRVLVGFLVHTRDVHHKEGDGDALSNFLSNLRTIAQQRALTLGETKPEAFASALGTDNPDMIKGALFVLSRSQAPRAATMAGSRLDHRDDEIFRFAVKALQTMATRNPRDSAVAREAVVILRQAKLLPDSSRVSFVKSVLRLLDPPEDPGDGGGE